MTNVLNIQGILEQLERDYMVNLNIIDMQILIRKIMDDYIARSKKEYSEEQIQAILPALEGFASRIIKLTETNLKSQQASKQDLEKRLEIMSQLFDADNPQKYKSDKL